MRKFRNTNTGNHKIELYEVTYSTFETYNKWGVVSVLDGETVSQWFDNKEEMQSEFDQVKNEWLGEIL